MEHKRRLQSCEYYDVDLNQWLPLAPLTQSRSHHSSVVVNKKIYTIGGDVVILYVMTVLSVSHCSYI